MISVGYFNACGVTTGGVGHCWGASDKNLGGTNIPGGTTKKWAVSDAE